MLHAHTSELELKPLCAGNLPMSRISSAKVLVECPVGDRLGVEAGVRGSGFSCRESVLVDAIPIPGSLLCFISCCSVPSAKPVSTSACPSLSDFKSLLDRVACIPRGIRAMCFGLGLASTTRHGIDSFSGPREEMF